MIFFVIIFRIVLACLVRNENGNGSRLRMQTNHAIESIFVRQTIIYNSIIFVVNLQYQSGTGHLKRCKILYITESGIVSVVFDTKPKISLEPRFLC